MSYMTSTNSFPCGEQIENFYIKGDYKEIENNPLILKGEVYNYEDEKDLINSIEKDGIKSVQEFKGSFSLIYCDNESETLYIANDKSGRETLFYYYDKNDLIVSDDFWEIVNIIEPSMFDIDIQSVKESFTFYHPLFYKTIIKNLYFLPPASIGKYFLNKNLFKLVQYWDFRYTPNEKTTLDEAIDRLDNLFDVSMQRLSKKYPSTTTFGLGLSGGLDSRLIPKYAQKYGLKLVCYIIGHKRPNKLFISHDFKIARRLAKYFNLDLQEVDYDAETYDKKSFYDIRFNPTGSSNLFIAVNDSLPNFDVLLAGTNGGELLGGLIPLNVNKLNKEELLDSIIGTFSYMNTTEKSSFSNKLEMFIRTLFNRPESKNIRSNKRNWINGIITKNEFSEIRLKLRKFIEDNSDKTNLDIFQKYLFWHLISRNKYGSFDTLFGSKKSYGIYTDPYVFEESLKWKPTYLLNKRLQFNFFIKKANYLGKISAQDYKVPISNRSKSNKFKAIYYLVSYIIRGAGLKYSRWAQKKSYKDYSRKILLKKNKIFNDQFDVNKVLGLTKYDMRMYEDIVKVKKILDLIATKGYKRYFK